MQNIENESVVFTTSKGEKILASPTHLLLGKEGEEIRTLFNQGFGFSSGKPFVVKRDGKWQVIASNMENHLFTLYVRKGEDWYKEDVEVQKSDVAH